MPRLVAAGFFEYWVLALRLAAGFFVFRVLVLLLASARSGASPDSGRLFDDVYAACTIWSRRRVRHGHVDRWRAGPGLRLR